SKDAQSGNRHISAERIRDEIDLMPERRQRLDAVVLAERRPARLEERLGRDHQNAHGVSDFRTICSKVPTPPHEMSDEDPRPSSARRRYAMAALKLTVSVALLAILFSRLDASRLWEGARHASLPWLIVALAIYALNIAASTWRSHVLLKAQDVPARRRTLFKSLLG